MTPLLLEFPGKTIDCSSRTHLMGILNVTPDSFSDGGRYFDLENAVAQGEKLATDGADMVDIGGESTRPGADPLPLNEEIRRVVPVIEQLARRIDIPISVDTYKSQVANAALEAGACIVNDISGLTSDPQMLAVVLRQRATVVLMHMAGTPRTMQENPHYVDVVQEVREFLAGQATLAHKAGVKQIIVDPGIGFGKNLNHNFELMRNLRACSPPGYPVLVGPSRKSFIGKILQLKIDERLEGTAAAVAACILRGAHIVRVHDVKEMKRVALVADALKDTERQS
jgi:dihydropteroate synthase